MKIKEIKYFKITLASVISCIEATHYNLGPYLFGLYGSLKLKKNHFKIQTTL